MQEAFKKEEIIKEKTEIEREIELIKNIIKTREKIKNDNKKIFKNSIQYYKLLF